MIKSIMRCLPEQLQKELARYETAQIEELRVRKHGLSTISVAGKECVLHYNADGQAIEQIISALSKHSIYSFMEELKQGYFTVQGGLRVGVAGKTVFDEDKLTFIRDFSSVNIRFCRQIKGAAGRVLGYLLSEGRPLSALIISPPAMGKTTLLRDAVRIISDSGIKCTLIDERSELVSESFDIGKRTDVYSGCRKSVGISMALRSLSPELIATDEIGSRSDMLAIREAALSGVRVLATAHADDVFSLKRKAAFSGIIREGLFKRYLVLGDALGKGTLMRVYNEALEVLSDTPKKL